jgi:N-acetylglucosaminyl-diphospho-decaprenol L-rhamnosyltransferase
VTTAVNSVAPVVTASPPTVTISVISTGEADKLPSCLDSIMRQRFNGALRVVLVCNGVRDDCTSVGRTTLPGITIIENAVKRGFAENHNLALRTIPSDYGIVLNPDVVLDETCVAELVGAMERHPRAGIIGPLLRYPSGSVQPSARQFPRPMGTLVRRTPLRKLFGDRLFQTPHYLPPPSDDRTVDWMLGACLMVRATAWRELKGFDPGYRPLYIEDVDLAWRAWKSGWEVWQTARAAALHEHQAATDKVFFDKRTLWHANGMLRFVRKHPRILIDSGRPVPA